MAQLKRKPLDPEARRQRWVDDFQTIKNDAIRLATHYGFFKKFMHMVRASPIADEKSYFWPWLYEAYTASAVVHVRRICEAERKGGKANADRTISLGLLLCEIRDCCDLLSLDWFKQRYCARWALEGDCPARADEEFWEVCGKGEAHLPRHIVEADINSLKCKTATIRNFVDKHIAHRDRNAPMCARSIPIQDFDNAIDAIQKVISRYGSLLTCSDYMLEATVLEGLGIFTKPWWDPRRT